MELVMIFASMAAICSGITLGSAIAERRGCKVGASFNDTATAAAGFISLALVGLFFV